MIIETDAAAGEVLSAIEAVSKSDGRWQHLALPRKDRNQADNGGQHPWRVDGGFASTLLLFNPDTQLSNSVRLSVYTDGGALWAKLVTIAPMATVPVRLSDIINRQQPDDTGKTLPPGSTRGLVTWFTLAKPRIFGGLLQTDALSRIVRPYACGTTIALCDVSDSGTVIYGIGSVGDASADLSGCNSNGGCACVDPCGSAPALQGSTYSWSSLDPLVASLVSLPTDTTGQYQGNSLGSTESLVTVSDINGCAPPTASGAVTVNPVIYSVSPTLFVLGSTVDVTISGVGLSGTTAISAQGISFQIKSATSSSVSATASVSGSAQVGTADLTVTAAGQTSNARSIKKQKPSRFVRYDTPGAPGGIGPLVQVTDGDVVNLAGQVLKTHQCGIYRNYAYDLVDQDGASISATYTFTEYFTDYVGPVGTPPDQSYSITPNSYLADIQYFGNSYPSCLGSNDHEEMNQRFYVTVGTTRFDLSTVIFIKRGMYNGTATVDESITTP